MAHLSREDNIAYKEVVLRYVIALHRASKHLTIPALVGELIDDAENLAGGAKLECAVRDLDRDRLLCCQKGLIHPTAAGLQETSRPSLVGESRSSTA